MKKRAADKTDKSLQCTGSVCQETNSISRKQQIRNILYSSSAKGKLKVGSSDDVSEKQADSAAAGFSLGNKSAPYKTSAVNKPASVDLGIKEPGTALPTTQKQKYESYFGQSLSDVNIHTGSEASIAADAVNARAFTLGNNIYFGQGEYSPDSESGQAILTHEIAHTMQSDSGNTLRKWGASEHRAFGNIAGNKLVTNKGKLLNGLENINKSAKAEHAGLDYDKEYKIKLRPKTIYKWIEDDTPDDEFDDSYVKSCKVPVNKSLGWTNERAGDYSRKASYLNKNQSGTKGFLSLFDHWDFTTEALLARTNWNHFFPLAEREWEENHFEALEYADAAKEMLKRNQFSQAKKDMQTALVYEAFALHFLQDTFASGHQYPRAFDRVYKRSGFRSKTYHDLLCELKGGIDMRYSRDKSHKFRGDGNCTKKDEEIVGRESYNSIAQVYCRALGLNMSDIGAQMPEANPGPDIPKIMKDKDAAPIWCAMEDDLERFITTKNVVNKNVKSSSGMFKEDYKYILSEWDSAHIDKNGKYLDHDTLTNQGVNHNHFAVRFYKKILQDPGKLERNVDDNIVKFLLDKNGDIDLEKFELLDLPIGAKVFVLKHLLDSPSSKFDGISTFLEQTIVLEILCDHDDDKFEKIVKGVGLKTFGNSLAGDNLHFFVNMCATRTGPTGNLAAKYIIDSNNRSAARMLTQTWSWRDIQIEPIKFKQIEDKDWVQIIKVLLTDNNFPDDHGLYSDKAGNERLIIWIVKQILNNNNGSLIASAISENDLRSGFESELLDTAIELLKPYWDENKKKTKKIIKAPKKTKLSEWERYCT